MSQPTTTPDLGELIERLRKHSDPRFSVSGFDAHAAADALERLSRPVGDDVVERTIVSDEIADELFDLVYAHTVIKYDPEAGKRCVRAAIAKLGKPRAPDALVNAVRAFTARFPDRDVCNSVEWDDMLAALSSIPVSTEAPSDWWKPEPGDPYWMLEVRQGFDDAGAWLKNAHSCLTTHEPISGLRYPSQWHANNARQGLHGTNSGRFAPTEHIWIAPVSTEASVDAVERVARALHGVEESWYDYTWEQLPENVQAEFTKQARAALSALPTASELPATPLDREINILHGISSRSPAAFEARQITDEPWLWQVWDVEHESTSNHFPVLKVDSNGAAEDLHHTIALVCTAALNAHYATEASGEVVQADRLEGIARRNLRHYVKAAVFKCEADREAALNCLDVIEEALDGGDAQVAVLRSAFAASESLRDRLAHSGVGNVVASEREQIVAAIRATMSDCSGKFIADYLEGSNTNFADVTASEREMDFRAGWKAAVDAVFSPDTSIPQTVELALAVLSTTEPVELQNGGGE